MLRRTGCCGGGAGLPAATGGGAAVLGRGCLGLLRGSAMIVSSFGYVAVIDPTTNFLGCAWDDTHARIRVCAPARSHDDLRRNPDR